MFVCKVDTSVPFGRWRLRSSHAKPRLEESACMNGKVPPTMCVVTATGPQRNFWNPVALIHSGLHPTSQVDLHNKFVLPALPGGLPSMGGELEARVRASLTCAPRVRARSDARVRASERDTDFRSHSSY